MTIVLLPGLDVGAPSWGLVWGWSLDVSRMTISPPKGVDFESVHLLPHQGRTHEGIHMDTDQAREVPKLKRNKTPKSCHDGPCSQTSPVSVGYLHSPFM